MAEDTQDTATPNGALHRIPANLQVTLHACRTWSARCRTCGSRSITRCPDPLEAVKRLTEQQKESCGEGCGEG